VSKESFEGEMQYLDPGKYFMKIDRPPIEGPHCPIPNEGFFVDLAPQLRRMVCAGADSTFGYMEILLKKL